MAIWTRYSQTMSTNNNRINYRIKAVLNSQSVSNNRSNVTVSVQVWRNNTGYTTYGSGTAYVTINGSSYSASISSSQRFTYNSYTQVFSRTVNIPHNSDGSKTLNMNARISHSQFSSSTQSWSTNLNTIPRASSFTISGNTLGSRITVNISRASSSFTHEVIYDLPDGSRRAKWDGVGTSKTFTPSLSDAQYIPNGTSRTASITVNTYSGSTRIGTAKRTFTMYVPDSLRPSVSGLSFSIAGSGRDKSLGKYVQNISKVYASFSSSGVHGSSIRSNSITVRRVGGADSQTISGRSGTTAHAVGNYGDYEIIATARDSRGRTNTQRGTFTVQAYSPPSVSSFSAARRTSPNTTVDITRTGSWSHLGGDNPLTIVIEQKETTSSSWSQVGSTATGTTGSFNGVAVSTGHLPSTPYDFRVAVEDTFGRTATANSSVGTARALMTFYKDEGVGIGKFRERGVLDVDGDIYSNGVLYTVGGLGSIEIPEGADLNDYTANGFYHNRSNVEVKNILNTPENNAFSLLVQSHAGIQQTFTTYGGTSGTNWHQYIRHQYSGSWGPWEPLSNMRGNNSNGHWIRYGSGVQICWASGLDAGYGTTTPSGSLYKSKAFDFVYPRAFSNTPTVTASVLRNASDSATRDIRIGNYGHDSKTHTPRFFLYSGFHSTGEGFHASYIAIGRWK